MSHSSTLSLLRRWKVELEKIKIRCSNIGFCGSISVSIALSFCAAILSGCTVVFTNSPPNSQRPGADTELLGRWTGQDEQGNRGFIQFDSGSNREINVSIFGEKTDLGYRNQVFSMITTRIENYDYMVLRATDSPPAEGYVIARYSIKDGKLKIWILSVNKVKEAIANGELKGKVGGGAFADVTITYTSQEIAALLKSAKSKALFVCFGEFQRSAS